MAIRSLKKTDFIRCLLFLAMVICGLYIFVGVMMACGAYSHLGSTDPILVITYVSLVHAIALPLLYIAIGTTCGKPICLLIFLILNGAFILGLLIAVVVLSLGSDKKQHAQWTSNPLNHILVGVYLIDAVLLELLVGLFYRDVKKAEQNGEPNVMSNSSVITTTTEESAKAASELDGGNIPPSGPLITPQPIRPKRVHKHHAQNQSPRQQNENLLGGKGQRTYPATVPTTTTNSTAPARPARSPKSRPPPPPPSTPTQPPTSPPPLNVSQPNQQPSTGPLSASDDSGNKYPEFEELRRAKKKAKSEEASPAKTPISININYNNANSPTNDNYSSKNSKSAEEPKSPAKP